MLPPSFIPDPNIPQTYDLRARRRSVARVAACNDDWDEDERYVEVTGGSVRAVLDSLAQHAFMRNPHGVWRRPFMHLAYFDDAPVTSKRACVLWAAQGVWEADVDAGRLRVGAMDLTPACHAAKDRHVVALSRVTKCGDLICLLCASTLPPRARRLVDCMVPRVGLIGGPVTADDLGTRRTRVVMERLDSSCIVRLHFHPPLFQPHEQGLTYEDLFVHLGPHGPAVKYAGLKYAAVRRKVMNQGRELWFYPPHTARGLNADALWGLDLVYDVSGAGRVPSTHAMDLRSTDGALIRAWIDGLRVRENAAARRIQAAWRRAISDPDMLLCRRRLLREFEEAQQG